MLSVGTWIAQLLCACGVNSSPEYACDCDLVELWLCHDALMGIVICHGTLIAAWGLWVE